MRTWVYSYKTSDGLRHEGEMSAPSKDAVYEELRRQGIRAIRVVERIQPIVVKGVRKRVVFVLLAVAVVGAASCAFFWGKSRPSGSVTQTQGALVQPHDGLPQSQGGLPQPQSGSSQPQGNSSVRQARVSHSRGIESPVFELKPGIHVATPRPRMRIDLSSVTNLADVFKYESERFLVRFARPGVEVPTETALVPEDLYDALEADILVSPDDPKPVVDLKRVVAGLKEDARRHLSVGASLREWSDFLVGRQKMESQYRARIMENFSDDKDEMHRRLRAMGFE